MRPRVACEAFQRTVSTSPKVHNLKQKITPNSSLLFLITWNKPVIGMAHSVCVPVRSEGEEGAYPFAST